MNKAILIGRLAKDPEIRYTQGNEPMAICRFSIAVDRPYSRDENSPKVDFLNCISFGKRGENIGKYFQKGNKIAITGKIQTGEYTDKQGIKRYTTDIFVDDFEFVESSRNGNETASQQTTSQGFYVADDDVDEEDLPF